MTYSKEPRKRLFKPKPVSRLVTPREVVQTSFERYPRMLEALRHKEELVSQIPPHPDKYPNHPGLKGSLYNGVCNRTACGGGEAVMFNIFTRGYYCRTCAAGINWQPGKILCIPVDHDLTHEEMDGLYAEQSRKGW